MSDFNLNRVQLDLLWRYQKKNISPQKAQKDTKRKYKRDNKTQKR